MLNKTPARTDVIIVGGGLAGLAATTYLARAGRSVTLFEQAAAVGGRACVVDLGLVLSDPLQAQDAPAIEALANALKAGGAPLAERISIFWGSLATLSGAATGGAGHSCATLPANGERAGHRWS